MKKKILICCNAYPPHFIGGAELIAHAQAKQLQHLGYDILIFTGDPSENGQRHSLRREDYEGLPVYRIRLTYEDYDYKFENFTHKSVEKHFKNILNKFSPDIVHFHNIIGLSAGLIHIAKYQGIKTVVTLHDHWGFCFKNTLIKNTDEICNNFTHCSGCMAIIPGEKNLNLPIRMRQDFIAMQLEEVDVFISPSQYLANTYLRAGIPPEKMHVIWNGIDVQRFSHIEKVPNDDILRFTFIGYFGKHKGIHILLDALQYLNNTEKILINLIGDGVLFVQYKKEINDKKLNKVVKFWGKIGKIEDAYAHTDVFVLPSVWPENQPVSITEAMSAGIPVIASDSGGIPELVEERKTGFLFERGNSVDLANKMGEFILNPEKIKDFGKNAYKKMEKNTLQNQVNKIIPLYEESSKPQGDDECKRFLIACIGDNFPAESARLLDRFPHKTGDSKIRIVMYDWLQADQKKKVHLVWIVDPTARISAIFDPIKNKRCLLVPEKSAELKKIIKDNDCGLYYHNTIEILSCIEYLIHHDRVREILGSHGFGYYSKNSHQCPGDSEKKKKFWKHLFKYG
jgi:glycosyltransferase involved in cell wall biosynthesis